MESVQICTEPEPEAGLFFRDQSQFGHKMVKTFFCLILVAGLCKGLKV